jgi:hypothetical protein
MRFFTTLTGRSGPLVILRAIFYLSLLLVLLPSGSVRFQPLHVSASLLLAAGLFSSLVFSPNPNSRRAYTIALAVLLVLGGWIILQTVPVPASLGNPAWQNLAGFFRPAPPTISVSPGDTFESLISALLPFAAFLTTLLLFADDKSASRLVFIILVSGLAICVFGILQFLFFPKVLFLSEKKFYLDSLTLVFVNRNTAANYLAMLLILSAGATFHFLQRTSIADVVDLLIANADINRRRDTTLTLFFFTAGVVVFVALALTRSRAGMISGMCGLTLLLAIMAASTRPARMGGRGRWARLSALARTVVVIAGAIVVALIFSSQAILRAGAQGATDKRFCFLPDLIRMAQDNWLVGTGFGTFRNVFPSYRNAACGMDGVLFLAHDVYLEGLISLGIIFLPILFIVVGSLAYYLIVGVRKRRQYRWVPVAGLGILVLQILHNAVDFSIQNPGVSVIFAALMAAMVTVSTGRSSRKGLDRTVERPQLDAFDPPSL